MAIKAAVEEQKAAVGKLISSKSMTEALKAALADPPVKTKDLEIKVCCGPSGALTPPFPVPVSMWGVRSPRAHSADRGAWCHGTGISGEHRSGGHRRHQGCGGEPPTSVSLSVQHM